MNFFVFFADLIIILNFEKHFSEFWVLIDPWNVLIWFQRKITKSKESSELILKKNFQHQFIVFIFQLSTAVKNLKSERR